MCVCMAHGTTHTRVGVPQGADADGNLYVLDWNRNGRVSKLERLKD